MKSLYITEDRIFFITGMFFLAVQLLILSSLLFQSESRPLLLWLCNNFCFFLSYACFTRNMQMLKGVSYLGLIPQLLWMTDFISPAFGFNVSSITDYIAVDGLTYTNGVSIVLHMIVPPVILLLSFRTFPKVVSLVYAALYAAFLYRATLIFGMNSEDINCVVHACDIATYIPYYTWLWPIAAITLTLITYGFHRILYVLWWEWLPMVRKAVVTWYVQSSVSR